VHNFGTYFVTSQCWERRRLFQVDEVAKLFLHVLYSYAAQKRYRLHEFVVMPDHIHLILTPVQISIEHAMQLIKGGFSHAVRDTGRTALEVWQKGFTDRRLRNPEEYLERRGYIHANPVRAHLCARPEQYLYSSANPMFKLDPIPQRLKPVALAAEWHG
jgi:putative transposase